MDTSDMKGLNVAVICLQNMQCKDYFQRNLTSSTLEFCYLRFLVEEEMLVFMVIWNL